jgi:hypothetical protein
VSADDELRPEQRDEPDALAEPSTSHGPVVSRWSLVLGLSLFVGCRAEPDATSKHGESASQATSSTASQSRSGEGTPPSVPPSNEPAVDPDVKDTGADPAPALPWPACDAPDGSTVAAPRSACLTAAEVRAHLEFVAKERVPGSTHWQAVQDRCAETFTKNGFSVERVPFTVDDGGVELRGVNVIGSKRGRTKPEEVVLVGAHYEHIPGCAGADDNGSGTAALLALADELGALEPDRTLVLACWDQEETGLHGSRVHADSLEKEASKLVLALVFDTMGVRRRDPGSQQLPPGLDVVFADAAKQVSARESRGDFVAVLGNPPANAAASRFVELSPRGGVDAIALVLPAMLVGSDLAGDLHRSDHANFWIRGWPALMLTDTANFRTPTYHCLGAPDDVNTVDVEFITGIAQASLAMVEETTAIQ